ncbi:hypothetical protein SK069_15370 [Patulibacter brassicae]|uniref:DUF4386 domain-containing protein n=1 Tax=Patulibacter brassicae TaxID=1705717 RepID=A0ABU4VMF6_9ACTN|nr:hypothetical protein [Patulibacter brassicae]MDX8152978.1 hypothetical protein [Patulibacter brassicae]
MDRKIQLTCALTGLLLTALYGLGVAGFARMIPVNDPQASVATVVASYAEHKTGVLVGMSLLMFGASLMIVWGAAVAVQTRRAAPQHPILFHIQIAAAGTACMNGILLCLVGGLAAFRVGSVPGEVTQMLNDLFWLLWVLPGATFEIWCVAAGLAILADRRAQPVFPRWSGYFSFLVAFSFLPGFTGLLFQSGPFAYNGLNPWWIPTIMFFLWVMAMTPLTVRAIHRDASPDPRAALPIADPAVATELARLRAEIETERRARHELTAGIALDPVRPTVAAARA